jgi:2-haloacid dehalogenase
MGLKVAAFDAYGTLFDVAAAARAAAGEPGGETLAHLWPRLSETWRRKQLEYTWLRAVAGAHADFRTVTAEALEYALAAEWIDDPGLEARLMALYDELDAYPDAAECLERLRDAGLRTCILSNGAPGMLDSAVRAAGIGHLLDAVLSVEDVGVFKPHPRVYGMVGAHFDVAPSEVLFVSANGWDAACATGFGFATVWINRADAPEERLPWRAAHRVRSLAEVPGFVGA